MKRSDCFYKRQFDVEKLDNRFEFLQKKVFLTFWLSVGKSSKPLFEP